MTKYEIRVEQEYDSWGRGDDEFEYFHYQVAIFNNHLDNGTTLKVFGKSDADLSDARAYAYTIYAIMDASETRYVDQTR